MEASDRDQLPVSVATWKTSDVLQWLGMIGAHRYQERFRRAKVNGATLLTLQERHLATMGIDDPIIRRKIFLAIDVLCTEVHLAGNLPSHIAESAGDTKPKRTASPAAPALPLAPSAEIEAGSAPATVTAPTTIKEMATDSDEDTPKLQPGPAPSTSPQRGAGGSMFGNLVSGIMRGGADIDSEVSIKLYIAQMTTAVEHLQEIQEMRIMFDRAKAELISNQEADKPIDKDDNDVVLTQFTRVLEEERKKNGGKSVKGKDHWYDIMGPKLPLTPKDIAEQAKADLKFKMMRRGSRFIHIPKSFDNDDIEDDPFASSEDDDDADDAAADSNEKAENTKQFFIILPSNPYRLKWDLLIMVLVIYFGIMTPIELAFGDQIKNLAVQLIFDGLFFLDIVMNFITAFRIDKGPEKGTYEVRVREIARAYMRKWFWIDLIATVPLDMIIEASGMSFNSSFNKMVRMLRGFKLIRALKMSRIFKRLAMLGGGNPAVIRMGKYFGMLVLMWHSLGCLYWIVATDDGFGSNSWAPALRYAEADFITKYSQAVFWTVQAQTGVGRDLNPLNLGTTVFSIFAVCIACLLYTFIIGSSSSVLSSMDATAAEKITKLETISQFMQQRGVDPNLQRRIAEYYEFAWSSQHNIDLFPDLHETLKFKLQLALNEKLIDNVPMFKDISHNCLLSIISNLRSKLFLPKEFICLQGEKGTEMFFILRGKVEVMIPPRPPLFKRCFLKEGDFFGERSMMQATRRQFSVQAMNHCELLILQKSQVRRLVKQYPDFASSVQRHALGREKLGGWAKIQSVVKTVRMVRLIGGQVTFVDMFRKINGSQLVVHADGKVIDGIQKIIQKKMAKQRTDDDLAKRAGSKLLSNMRLKVAQRREMNEILAGGKVRRKKKLTKKKSSAKRVPPTVYKEN